MTDKLESYESYALTWIENAAKGRGETRDNLMDLLLFTHYGPDVFSQSGLGFCGFVIRHNRTDVLMTVKATDSGTPLVAFVTGQTTTGCIAKFFDLMSSDKLKWTKDKFPWI